MCSEAAAAQRPQAPDRHPPQDRRPPARRRGVALSRRGTRRPGHRRDGQDQHRGQRLPLGYATQAHPVLEALATSGESSRSPLRPTASSRRPGPVAPIVLRADLGPGAGNPPRKWSLGHCAYCRQSQRLLSRGVEA